VRTGATAIDGAPAAERDSIQRRNSNPELKTLVSNDLLIDRGGDSSEALGAPDEIRRAITAVFPETEWTPNGWGSLVERAGSIEFNISDQPPVTSFGLHLRGDFIVFLERVDRLAADNGWSVFDPQDPDG
jgi:hypothetical protein